MKHKILLLLTLAIVATVGLQAQLNVGSTAAADASAILQATSTTKGFLPPVMTTTQINAIVLPANGLTVYNTTLSQLQVNVGTPLAPSWAVGAGGANVYWSQQGNTGTVPGTNYIGTTDNASLAFGTNNAERVRIDSSTGFMGIGTTTPYAPLQLANTVVTRKMVLFDNIGNASNDSAFYGFGVNSGALRYQVPTGGAHSFYSNKTLFASMRPGSFNFYGNSTTVNSAISIGRLGNEGVIAVAGIAGNFASGSVPGDIIVRNDTGSLILETFSAKPLMLNTSNSERMRITPAGFIGINNSAPLTTLDIAGNMRLATTASGAATDSILTINGSTGIINKRTLLNVNSNIYNSDGTVTANRTMQLNGNTLTLNGNPGGWEGTGLNVLSGNINNGSFIGFGRTSSDGFVGIMSGGNNLAFANSVPGDMFILANQKLMMGTNSSAAVVVETSAAERMRITPAGNVGINTITPATKLQVVSDDNTLATNIIDAQANNLTYGTALYYSGVRTTGSGTNNNLFLDAKGTGAVLLNNATAGPVYIPGNLVMGANASANIVIGNGAGAALAGSYDDVFIGIGAGQSATTGQNNTFHGFYSGSGTTTGYNNVFVGFASGQNNTSGGNNTSIGAYAGPTSSNLYNSTSIGQNSHATGNNSVFLGDNNVSFIGGYAPYTNLSDARFKYNIKANVLGLAFIQKLRPVTYQLDAKKLDRFNKDGVLLASFSKDGNATMHTGFLAQEVEKAANELGISFDGIHKPENDRDHYSLAYAQFVVPLVKGMQEQQAQIEKLTQQNIAITAQNAEIIAHNKTLDAQNKAITAQLSDMAALKLAVAQLRSELNKTTVTQAVLPIPVTVKN